MGAAFGAVVEAAVAEQAHVVFLTGTGRSGDVRKIFATSVQDDSDVGDKINLVNRDRAQEAMTTAFREAETAALGSSSSGAVDLLAVIRNVDDLVRGIGNGRVELVLMSDPMLRTPIDLVKHPELLEDPAGTAEALDQANRLPQLSEGWRVTILTPSRPFAQRAQALTCLLYEMMQRSAAELVAVQPDLIRFPAQAMARPLPPGVVRIASADKVVLRVPDSVFFDFDSAKLRPEARPVIETLAEMLKADPNAIAHITGHTDGKGPQSFNDALSRRRAEAVADAVVAAGIDASRISTAGMGERDPVASNASAAGRAENRRTEIQIVGAGA